MGASQSHEKKARSSVPKPKNFDIPAAPLLNQDDTRSQDDLSTRGDTTVSKIPGSSSEDVSWVTLATSKQNTRFLLHPRIFFFANYFYALTPTPPCTA